MCMSLDNENLGQMEDHGRDTSTSLMEKYRPATSYGAAYGQGHKRLCGSMTCTPTSYVDLVMEWMEWL